MYREAIGITPRDYTLWGNLGDALSQIPGKENEYREAYEQALELAEQQLGVNPDEAITLAERGHYCASLGRLECATDSIEKALSLEGQDLYIHYYAALVSVRSDDHELGVTEVEKALDLGFPLVILQADPLLEPLWHGAGQTLREACW